MYKKTYIILFLCHAIIVANGQSVENILSQISQNNKTLKSNNEYSSAKKLDYSTGRSLYNPTISFEYLKGSPVGAGNQVDLVLIQSFDFPTSYAKRKQMSEEQSKNIDIWLNKSRQDILLEAKQLCIEVIYWNKRLSVLEQRKSNISKLVDAFESSLKDGNENLLNVNKAKLQHLALDNEISTAKIERNKSLQNLVALNGGEEVELKDTLYPLQSSISDFETLESTIESSDLELQKYQQEKMVVEKQVQVVKAMSMPKMDLGYHSQAILGQQYHGAHVGLSIPLWEDKNKVKTQNARVMLADARINEHRTKHYNEIKTLFDQTTQMNKNINKYSNLLESVNNESLLSKSLELGQISVIEYFMELNYYYSSIDKLQELEKNYNKLLAELYKFEL